MSRIRRGPPCLTRPSFLHLAVLALLLPLGAPLAAQNEAAAPAVLTVTSSSKEATQRFYEGLTEAENVATPHAVQLMDQAIALDPNFGLALAVKAFIDGGLSRTEREATFSKAIGALGSATPAEIAFATGLREWRAGHTTEARQLLNLAARAVPGDPHVAYYRAVLITNSTTPQQGVTAMRAVTKRFPDNGPAFNNLAYGLYNAGDTEGGLEAANRYLELLPDHWNAHDTQAELLGWEGRYDDALAHYDRVVSMSADQLQGYTGRSEIYTMMGRGQDARAALTDALRVATTDAQKANLHRAIGNSFALQGDRKNAVRELSTAAQMATAAKNANLAALANQEMALWEAAIGSRASIQRYLDAAKTAGGPAWRQTSVAALALAVGGDIQAATAAAAELETLASTRTNEQGLSHQVNALVKLRGGDAAGAKKEITMADPSDLMTKAILARTYKALGQKAAVAALRQDVLNDRRANLFSTPWVLAQIEARNIKM